MKRSGIPSRVTFAHYGELFTRLNLGRYLFNSALIAFVVTGVSLVINSMAGYAFAKLRFRGRGPRFLKPTPRVVLYRRSALDAFLLASERGSLETNR